MLHQHSCFCQLDLLSLQKNGTQIFSGKFTSTKPGLVEANSCWKQLLLEATPVLHVRKDQRSITRMIHLIPVFSDSFLRQCRTRHMVIMATISQMSPTHTTVHLESALPCLYAGQPVRRAYGRFQCTLYCIHGFHSASSQ